MISFTKPILIIMGVLAFLGITGAGITGLQRRNDEKIVILQQALGKAQAALEEEHKAALAEAKKGEEWKGVAQAALDRVGRLEGRLKGVEAKLAAMGTQAPATAPESLPTEAPAIAKAMTDAGVKAFPIVPTTSGLEVGLATTDARVGLGLIMDGKNYPQAISRIVLLEEEVGVIKEQKTGLEEAVAAKTQEANANKAAYESESLARESAEETATIQRKISDQKDALLKKERVKKWVFGGSGLAFAALVLLL